MKPDFVFGDSDPERVRALQVGFRCNPHITAREVHGSDLFRLPGVDAVFVTPMDGES